MKYKVIDNFLDEEYFNFLEILFTERGLEKEGNPLMPWCLNTNIVSGTGIKKPASKIDKLFYMTHMLYAGNTPQSPFYEKLVPLLEKLKARCLIRIKANLYPNTEILHEHSMHTDYDFSHSAAILSLNTCNGYTKLKDSTKIDSVANRVLLFDASEEHCSTTTTNVYARINININYF